LLPQRSKHPREMVITPKASTSSFDRGCSSGKLVRVRGRSRGRGRGLGLTLTLTSSDKLVDRDPCKTFFCISFRVAQTANEQALVSLKLKKPVDAGVGRTFAVRIEGG